MVHRLADMLDKRRALTPVLLGAGALASAGLCAARAVREAALESVIRSGACGGVFESQFALGQCWHCSAAAALTLLVVGAAFAVRASSGLGFARC